MCRCRFLVFAFLICFVSAASIDLNAQSVESDEVKTEAHILSNASIDLNAQSVESDEVKTEAHILSNASIDLNAQSVESNEVKTEAQDLNVIDCASLSVGTNEPFPARCCHLGNVHEPWWCVLGSRTFNIVYQCLQFSVTLAYLVLQCYIYMRIRAYQKKTKTAESMKTSFDEYNL